MKQFINATLLIMFLAVNSSVAAEDDPLLAAIEARKAYMQVVKFNAGPLFAMAKGELEYDPDLATTLANNLQALSSMSNGSMWPEGTDNVAYEGETRALAEIWSTYPEVADANKAWAQAVTELSAVAGSSVDELRDKIGAVGKGCKGCHDDFRAEDN